MSGEETPWAQVYGKSSNPKLPNLEKRASGPPPPPPPPPNIYLHFVHRWRTHSYAFHDPSGRDFGPSTYFCRGNSYQRLVMNLSGPYNLETLDLKDLFVLVGDWNVSAGAVNTAIVRLRRRLEQGFSEDGHPSAWFFFSPPASPFGTS